MNGRARQLSIKVRSASPPSLWPRRRVTLRSVAQRPFPSIIIAICSGKAGAEEAWTCATSVMDFLYAHDIFFFGNELFVNFFDVIVGQFLDFIRLGAVLVLGNLFVFFLFLDLIHS